MVNVQILGVVNVLLANDSQSSQAISTQVVGTWDPGSEKIKKQKQKERELGGRKGGIEKSESN